MIKDEVLERNLKRFITFCIEDKCNNILSNLIEKAIRDGESEMLRFGKINGNNETHEFEKYKLIMRLERLD